jgi:hypothetical protein
VTRYYLLCRTDEHLNCVGYDWQRDVQCTCVCHTELGYASMEISPSRTCCMPWQEWHAARARRQP